MKKRVTLLTSLLAASGIAHAADTTEFKWNAEVRGRFHSDSGMALDTVANANEHQQSYWEQRNKLGVTATKGESLNAHVTLLNNMDWGRASAIGQPSYAASADAVFVSEAFAWWKATENIGLRLGRMTLTVADGSVIAANDWQRTPFSFDGAGLIFDYDFAKISALGVEAQELGQTYGQLNTTTGTPQTGGNRDPETDFYGISVDVKNTPDWLKMANVHYIQENTGATTSAPGGGSSSIGRYGVTVGGEVANLDYSATYAGLNGKVQTANIPDITLTSFMYQAMVGYKIPEMLGLHFDVSYHQDSGNDSTTSTTTQKTYQPFFYDRQKFGGQMQIIGWGNLTYYQADVSVQPSDATAAGAKYTVYSRTQTTDSAYYANTTANAYNALGSNAINPTYTGNSNNSAIGSEINVYANHGFDGGFFAEIRYGMFMASDYLKNSTSGARSVDNAQSVMLEGKFVF